MAFLLVSIITSAVRGKVEQELSPECREFLYMETPPSGLEHHSLQFICQRYNKKARYVTLYNTVDHIPIYSAYTYKRSDGEKCVDVPWMYEPQVKNKKKVGHKHESLLTLTACCNFSVLQSC